MSAITPVSSPSAAMQEAVETAAQTVQEASKGDVQAQRLLQRRGAATSNNPPQSHALQGTRTTPPPVFNTSGQVTGKIINTKA